jgi:hypothetical protein
VAFCPRLTAALALSGILCKARFFIKVNFFELSSFIHTG